VSSNGTGEPNVMKSAAKGTSGESESITSILGGIAVVNRPQNLSTGESAPVGILRPSSSCVQTGPVGPSDGRDMAGGLPARRDEVIFADKGVLARPNGSWVAGRTGFGPIDTGKVTDIPKAAESLNEAGVGTADPVASMQSKDQVFLGGSGESEQGTAIPAPEVYCRKKEKINGAVLPLSCATAGTGLTEDDGSEVGLEGSYVEDSVEASGVVLRSLGSVDDLPSVSILKRKVGVVIEERADSPIARELNRTMEVGSFAGLTGQKELLADCFKKIIVDKHGKGGEGNGVDIQQEVESPVQERGNCSDYEA
jgi:hypothetical protein